MIVITEGKRQDLTVARLQPFAPDTVLVFDMGYIDYAWLALDGPRGTSRNALHIQIWTALIALLLLKYLQLKATLGWSVSNLVALLRMNPFAYRDLWPWLHDPFTAPPPLPEPVQSALAGT